MAKSLAAKRPSVPELFKPPPAQPCQRCGWPVEQGDSYCPACGLAQEEGRIPPEPPPTLVECTCCGAPLATSSTERSYTCEYCGSSFVFDYSGGGPGAYEPEFVLPFLVSPDEARQRIAGFVRRRRFVPAGLRTQLATVPISGVYLPVWHFSASAHSDWSVEIGEYWYRTETYTVIVNGRPQVRTRQVRYTEWWPLSGKFHRYWSGCLVPASQTITQDELDLIGPFRLEGLKRYRPEFLAGWPAENYTVSKETALSQAEDSIRNWQEEAIARFLPGDTYRALVVETALDHIEADLVLLPVYYATYKWNGTKRRILVNGQTGKAAGTIPRDWKRVVVIVLIILVLLVGFSLLINLLEAQVH
ncbi:MAG: zinc ribbon domain-containing protein [Thermoguttaceae bacterium]|nr:zinc ribbon domain-containing protein [Thermoguttaceae bacterium]MDW8077480.1 zinc ribbon domain-containing protein [Thermoguttaceae bacterium]